MLIVAKTLDFIFFFLGEILGLNVFGCWEIVIQLNGMVMGNLLKQK